METNSLVTIPNETIISRIFLIRGKKVMLDEDLAKLYGVTTGELNKSVKRNHQRFPEDFKFQITTNEFRFLIFQIGISKIGRGGRRTLPQAFTEQGIAMLSSVLHSNRAIQTNIQIIRTFSKLREILSENKKLAEKLELMEQKYDKKIATIFKVIKYLVTEEEKPKGKFGFDVTVPAKASVV